jgi:hypothetical protein
MAIEKNVLLYDIIWAFQEDILQLRVSYRKTAKAHESQPWGIPLHRYRGLLTMDADKIKLEGEDTVSNVTVNVSFSLGEVKDVHLGWDNTLRKWRDTRASIRPLRITFQDGGESKTMYMYAKKQGARIYGRENETVVKYFMDNMPPPASVSTLLQPHVN